MQSFQKDEKCTVMEIGGRENAYSMHFNRWWNQECCISGCIHEWRHEHPARSSAAPSRHRPPITVAAASAEHIQIDSRQSTCLCSHPVRHQIKKMVHQKSIFHLRNLGERDQHEHRRRTFKHCKYFVAYACSQIGFRTNEVAALCKIETETKRPTYWNIELHNMSSFPYFSSFPIFSLKLFIKR